MITNPLKNLHVSTYLETKKLEAIEKRNEAVLEQARDIHELLKNADLKNGYVTVPPFKWSGVHRENKDYLCENGFRIWEISEVRLGSAKKTYAITWDCKDFQKHYEDYVEFGIKNDYHISKCSYKEI